MTPPQIIDEIQKLMGLIAAADYKHWQSPVFLELLEDGEDWVKKMREFITNGN